MGLPETQTVNVAGVQRWRKEHNVFVLVYLPASTKKIDISCLSPFCFASDNNSISLLVLRRLTLWQSCLSPFCLVSDYNSISLPELR